MPDKDDSAPVGDRPARFAAIGIAAGRIAIGAGIWLAPERTWRALGLGGTPAAGAALALGRMAATRDLVLGAAALAALGDRERLRRVSAATAVVDAGDVLAFALTLREGGELREAGIRGLAAALPATLVGAWIARRLASEATEPYLS